MNEHRTFRVRTEVGKDGIINVPIKQTFDTIDILSLKISQKNAYKLYDCGYGIIVGRVIANQGFGIPNAKISIFIPMENSDDGRRLEGLYNFSMTNDRGEDGNMYNLLPEYVDKACHQDVGSFYNKRFVLDNEDVIEVFEKYYKYTTTSNQSGDYIIYGVPTGSQLLHVDIDLSDIGILSQTPRDMVYQNFSLDMFDSPTKFKKDSNLNTLAQIKRQTKSVFVQPFWGDTTEYTDNVSIVRCDIDIDYKFVSTCVFLGSVITDTGEESINKNCRTTKDSGRMDKLTTGPGMIEMIRLNERGGVEQVPVKGEKLIDDNGVWCYQIPMNLDYVKTDEFGKMVPSDNPEKGIATRAEVRFRISMDEVGEDGVAKKRARYLVPNNPELYSNEIDNNYDGFYAFGTKTERRDFRNLYWNCVYTVKSYIPRLQKTKKSNDLKFTGIKAINRPGDNNPLPFNSLSAKLPLVFSILCVLLKLVIRIVYTINAILTPIAYAALKVYLFLFNIADKISRIKILKGLAKIFCKCANANNTANEPCDEEDLPEGESCDDADHFDADNKSHVCTQGEAPSGGLCHVFYEIYRSIGCGIGLNKLCDNGYTYYPGCWQKEYDYWSTDDSINDRPDGASNNVEELFNCLESNLAEENDVFSFNFANDWINGVLYFPLWFRYIKKKRTFFFKLIETKGIDRWCNAEKNGNKKLRLFKTCSMERSLNQGGDELTPIPKEKIPTPISDEWYKIPAGMNIVIGYGVAGFKKNNCYGFRCIKTALSNVNGLHGIVKQKKARESDEISEYVYYYTPGEKMPLKYDDDVISQTFVKMFSTDIVLLGSLHDCDPQGIPQFFKNLPSTTYNMPPKLVVNDGEEYYPDSNYEKIKEDDTDNTPELFVPGTEYALQTGADWGLRGERQCNSESYYSVYHNQQGVEPQEQYADGGLFYGITCSHIYTKPKTCINLERICEYGVSPDVALSILYKEQNSNLVTEKMLLPDGYISYDDIADNDGRTDFATMNSNNLRTRINKETGYKVYDFTPYYLDNFDGSLYSLMGDTNCKCQHYDEEINNYYFNNTLELNNHGYSYFRYGTPIKILGLPTSQANQNTNMMSNGNIIKFNRGFISTLNSFYFYFGLKFGKTAIDKFFINYFSPCDVDETAKPKTNVDIVPNSVCNGGDGYVSIFIEAIDKPYSIAFYATNDLSNDVYVYNLKENKIYFGSSNQTLENLGYVQVIDQTTNLPVFLENDMFHVEIVDNNGILVDGFDIDYTTGVITSTITPVEFVLTNEALFSQNNTTYYDIESDYTRYDNAKGGYILFSKPTNSLTHDEILNYRVTIEPYNEDDFPETHDTVSNDSYDGCSFDCVNGVFPQQHTDCFFEYDTNVEVFVVGVPKGGVRYKITLTEMCGTQLSNNTFESIIFVGEGKPLKLKINGIDYDLIKNFLPDPNYSFYPFANETCGWLDMGYIGISIGLENLETCNGAYCFRYIHDLSIYSDPTLICFYNWPENCFYNLTDFIPGSVVLLDVLPNYQVNNEEYIFYIDTSNNNQMTVYHRDNLTETYNPLSVQDQIAYFNGLQQEEQDNLKEGISTVLNRREKISYDVRSAFFTKTADSGVYSMKIEYEGGAGVVQHFIRYTKEDNNGFPTAQNILENVENIIPDQFSPTIEYDTNTGNNYSKYFVRNNNTKQPYCYAVKDGHTSIPTGVVISNNTISNGFNVHIIDKGMDSDYEIWTPMNNFPNMKDPDDKLFLSMDGFIGLVLKNGISTKTWNDTGINSRNPKFEVCKVNTDNDFDVELFTVSRGVTLPMFREESIPNCQRISLTRNYIAPQGMINITRYNTIGQNSFYGGIIECIPIKYDYSETASFICDDGRENVSIKLYPKYSINFNSEYTNQNFSLVDFNFASLSSYIIKVRLVLVCEGGYNPSYINCFADDGTQNTITYPLSYNGGNGLNLDSTILKWDNYDYVTSNICDRISNPNTPGFIGTCDEDSGVYRINFQLNGDDVSKVFAISANSSCEEHKYLYGLSHLIDCTILKLSAPITYNSSTDKSVISIYNFNNGSGFFVTHFEFDVLGLNIHGDFDGGPQHFPAQNNLPFTIEVDGDWTNYARICIKDVSGVIHKVVPYIIPL